jgi:hypothetical protein
MAITFRQYLSEGAVQESNDFEEALGMMKRYGTPNLRPHRDPLYRGIGEPHAHSEVIYFPYRESRAPKDSSPVFNFLVNTALEEKTGLDDARQKAYFATNDISVARSYGAVYFCIPLGDTTSISTIRGGDSWDEFSDVVGHISERVFNECVVANPDSEELLWWLSSELSAANLLSRIYQVDGRKMLNAVSNKAVGEILVDIDYSTRVFSAQDITVVVAYCDLLISRVMDKLKINYNVSDLIPSVEEVMLISNDGHLCVDMLLVNTHYRLAHGYSKFDTGVHFEPDTLYSWLISHHQEKEPHE